MGSSSCQHIQTILLLACLSRVCDLGIPWCSHQLCFILRTSCLIITHWIHFFGLLTSQPPLTFNITTAHIFCTPTALGKEYSASSNSKETLQPGHPPREENQTQTCMWNNMAKGSRRLYSLTKHSSEPCYLSLNLVSVSLLNDLRKLFQTGTVIKSRKENTGSTWHHRKPTKY